MFAALLAGCVDLKRSACVRTEKRQVGERYCSVYERGGCRIWGYRENVEDVCVERRCRPGFDHGPNDPTYALFVPRGCLTKEEAKRQGEA